MPQDPSISPDSAPSDFYLFPKLKSHLPGRPFGNNPYCTGVPGDGGGGGVVWQAANRIP